MIGYLFLKIKENKIWRFSSLVLALHISCAKGTEVGNGNRAEETEASAPGESAGPVQNDSENILEDWLSWLLAPCGSPLREANSQSLSPKMIEGDLLLIEKQAERRFLSYQERQWQLEPVEAKDPTDFRVSISELSADSATSNDKHYECSQVRSTADQTERQMSISMDGVDAELLWFRNVESGLLTEIIIKLPYNEVIVQGTELEQ